MIRSLVLILFFPITINAQVNGVVIDKESKKPIPYASIGLLKHNIGTSSDQNGRFTLPKYASGITDTIIVSSVGYSTCKLLFNNDSGFLNISLPRKQVKLSELVIVTKQKFTTAQLNSKKCGKLFFLSCTENLSQVAQKFTAPVSNSILNSVIICTEKSSPQFSLFRVRVYNIDSTTKLPSNDLTYESIEVHATSQVVKVNLEEYKIVIPEKDFFVAIEWLKLPINERSSTRKMNGKEVNTIYYLPSVGISESTLKTEDYWWLSSNNQWRKSFPGTKSVASISVNLKY